MSLTRKLPSARLLIVKSIWFLGLRGAADKIQFIVNRLRSASSNYFFRRNHPDFPTPPHELIFDANHNVTWQKYYQSGLTDAHIISGKIRANIKSPAASVLEWGCGPGRIIRHLPSCLRSYSTVTITGSDNNVRSIAWCRTNIPDISFVENSLEPPIALPENSFDFIYSISVFTHLSEASILAWMKEIHRLLRTGGYFLFTTHGENFLRLLTRDQVETFHAGKLVTRAGDDEGKKLFGTFHPKAWIEAALAGTCFSVLSFEDGVASGFGQDLWVAQKTA